MLTKQETLLGRGTQAKSHRSRNPGGLPCLVAHSLGFYDDGISFWVVLGKEVKSLGHVQLFSTPWTVAYHAPPSMGFSRQEY